MITCITWVVTIEIKWKKKIVLFDMLLILRSETGWRLTEYFIVCSAYTD